MNDSQFIIAVTVPSVVALVGAVGVFITMLVNNSRLSDLNARVSGVEAHLDTRIDDLKRYIDLNTKMILDKIDSLHHRLTDLEVKVRRSR